MSDFLGILLVLYMTSQQNGTCSFNVSGVSRNIDTEKRKIFSGTKLLEITGTKLLRYKK